MFKQIMYFWGIRKFYKYGNIRRLGFYYAEYNVEGGTIQVEKSFSNIEDAMDYKDKLKDKYPHINTKRWVLIEDIQKPVTIPIKQIIDEEIL